MERTVRTAIGLNELDPVGALFTTSAFDIPNVHCSTCAATLEGVLGSLPGVRRAVVFTTGRVEITFDPTVITSDELLQGLASGGFHATRVPG